MLQNKRNVMILIASSNINTGPVKGIIQFLLYADRSQFNFYFFNFRLKNDLHADKFKKDAQQLGIDTYFLNQGRHAYISLIKQAIKIIKNRQINIVQTHGFKPSVIGFFLKLICRVKWICFMHGTTSENFKVKLYNFIDNIVQCFAHRTVIVSEAQRDKIFLGHNHLRVRVLHNAVDFKNPLPNNSKDYSPVQEALKLTSDSKLLVVVGRLSPEKGVDVFIKAFGILAADTPEVHAIIVGDGQELKKLEAQVLKANFQDRIHFVGYSESPGNYINEAYLVVVPSRSEGIPNVVLEAMALGKPVVSTAVGGVPEIIEDGISGRLVPSERPDLLAKAIQEILSNFALYQRISAGGKKRVQIDFEVMGRVRRLLALYDEVLAEN
ncbi:MAG: hypothetical protein B6I30_10410 [Desulfobacteraceae bacterium 4572_187]|nr:MAG: hypothetical protein B6I30_10410 [Desulfobacteraceae bacterium 4572_187]